MLYNHATIFRLPFKCKAQMWFQGKVDMQTQHFSSLTKWPNVFDIGSTLHKCDTNVSCLLGYAIRIKYLNSTWLGGQNNDS